MEAESTAETEIIEAVEPVLKEPETKISDEEREKEQDVLIIAQVNDYVNIRSTASTDGEIVGKLYNNSVGTLVAKDGDWYQVKSGSVEGYVKAEYFKTGDEAEKIADEVGQKMATVNTETLKVRSEASLEASVIGLVPGGEELSVLDEENGFVKVSIEEGDRLGFRGLCRSCNRVCDRRIHRRRESQNCRRRKGKRRRKESRAGSGRAYESEGKGKGREECRDNG